MLRSLLGILLATASIQGQHPLTDFNRHGWYSYSGDHGIAGPWGLHFDAQWRRSNVITGWQQYQLRPGLNFEPRPNLLLTLGYAYTRTYPYGDFPVTEAYPEHRIYQQAQLRHELGKTTLQQRARLEQRYIAYPDEDSFTYQNRFRYMLKADFKVNEQWYVPVSNEILLNVPSFDQNRLFGGIGYSLGDAGKLELGYMTQFARQRGGRVYEFNHTLIVSFSSNVRLRD
jgi:hypothetical protein